MLVPEVVICILIGQNEYLNRNTEHEHEMRLQDILRKLGFLSDKIIFIIKVVGFFYLSHKCSGGDGIWEKQSVRNEGTLKQRLIFLIWFSVL